MLFNRTARIIRSTDRLSTTQIEAILKARKANEPSLFDGVVKTLDESQAYVRTGVADGLSWLASCLKP